MPSCASSESCSSPISTRHFRRRAGCSGRGRFLFQRVGSHHGKRVRGHCRGRAGFSLPEDPPRFLSRTPYGYHDRRTIERDLANGGFTAPPRIDTLAARSRAASPHIPAVAFCQGTPLRNEIEARDASGLGEATDPAAEATAERFGRGDVDGKIQAHVVTIEV